MLHISEQEGFGAQKVPPLISYLRDMAYKTAQKGKKRNIYSHIVRTYSKIFRRPFEVTWEGVNLRVLPNENSGDRWIFRVGIHSEYEDLNYLKTLYGGKNLSVIDIGANIGVYTLYLSKILGPKSQIVCFEPHPDTFNRLMTNLAFNPNDNIVPMDVGIGDTDGTAWLYRLNSSNAGENSLLSDNGGEEKTEVQIRTLESVVREQGITQIDFLKIDIEDNRDQWATDCFQYFSERGYEVALSHEKNGNTHFMR